MSEILISGSTATENSSGQMEGCTEGTGIMENKTEEGCTKDRMDAREKANGRTARRYVGWMNESSKYESFCCFHN